MTREQLLQEIMNRNNVFNTISTSVTNSVNELNLNAQLFAIFNPHISKVVNLLASFGITDLRHINQDIVKNPEVTVKLLESLNDINDAIVEAEVDMNDKRILQE